MNISYTCTNCNQPVEKAQNAEIWVHEGGQIRCYPSCVAEPGKMFLKDESEYKAKDGDINLDDVKRVEETRKGLVSNRQQVFEGELIPSDDNPEAFVGWHTGPR